MPIYYDRSGQVILVPTDGSASGFFNPTRAALPQPVPLPPNYGEQPLPVPIPTAEQGNCAGHVYPAVEPPPGHVWQYRADCSRVAVPVAAAPPPAAGPVAPQLPGATSAPPRSDVVFTVAGYDVTQTHLLIAAGGLVGWLILRS